MKKIFLVVLYKCKVEESKTCQSLKHLQVLDNTENLIYIWDNSPEVINDEESVYNFFQTRNFEYKHTPENISLSVIYNTVIHSNDYDFIQIFDQDSYIIKENYDNYLNTLLEREEKLNIFVPKIYSNNYLYSPGKFFIKGSHFKDIRIGKNTNRFYTVITSGIVIRLSWMKKNNLCFNENLKLYCIDTDFICKCRRLDPSFYVMDIQFIHDLSESHLTIEQKKNRRKVQLEGIKEIYKNNFLCQILIMLYEFLLKITGRI